MIKFNKLIYTDIYPEEFKDFSSNNILDFSPGKIAIVYGPNGSGKTTLSRILNSEDNNCEYSANYNGEYYGSDSSSNLFHIIPDQNKRNIISGNTSDFIVGENIRREYELKEILDSGFISIFAKLGQDLKLQFQISKSEFLFKDRFQNTSVAEFVSDIANPKSRGKKIKRSEFIDAVDELSKEYSGEVDDDKFKFFITDINKKKESKILHVLRIRQISKNPAVRKVEQNDTAINVLNKYTKVDECIVCDNKIERLELLEYKKKSKETNLKSLDPATQELLEKIINGICGNDPFSIKDRISSAISLGDISIVDSLNAEFNDYIHIYEKKVTELVAASLSENPVKDSYSEYSKILKKEPLFSDDDVIFIEKFVSNSLDRTISLKRDDTNHIQLLFDNKKILGEDRSNLSLSNGEQNFISLVFELLKAKKSSSPIVVVDDPISSFDSIYKNKIAYAMIKFLEGKKQIVLTHNTDLIQLLEHQKKNCFNLFRLNIRPDSENGFIKVSTDEQDLLLYLHKLLDFLRGDIEQYICNKKLFLISVIPFMRGYSQLTNQQEHKNALTDLMHGYCTSHHDIEKIYRELFNSDLFQNSTCVSAKDISELEIDRVQILHSGCYPLLDRTLYHSLTYLFLRLNVEKKLVKKYSINTRKYKMLGEIIFQAFAGSDNLEKRLFLLSRKTLLNEFNHFDTNMSIFQPAIDITTSSLKKEKDEIIEFLDRISQEADD